MRLEIPSSVAKRMRALLLKAGKHEIGGILMAEQIEPGVFQLMNYSVDTETGGRAHFVRSPEHHAAALQEFFKKTGNDYERYNYLGEWHSHPTFLPVPSHEDIAAMNDLVRNERNIPFALLLIVRTSWFGSFQCTGTFFQIDSQPVAVDIVVVKSS